MCFARLCAFVRFLCLCAFESVFRDEALAKYIPAVVYWLSNRLLGWNLEFLDEHDAKYPSESATQFRYP